MKHSLIDFTTHDKNRAFVTLFLSIGIYRKPMNEFMLRRMKKLPKGIGVFIKVCTYSFSIQIDIFGISMKKNLNTLKKWPLSKLIY